MKTLVVYYSLEGNTQLVADMIAKELSCDVLVLKTKKEVPKKGFMKYMWGGKQVVLGEKPEIEPVNTDFNQYDLIIMGSPVWASSYAPAFNTLFESISIKNKKIALFCCYAGNEGKTFSAFKNKLTGNEFIGEIGFKDPSKNDKGRNNERVRQWLRDIKAL